MWRFYTIPGPGEPGNETWSGDSWKNGGGGRLEHRRLRSRTQPHLLGHRQSLRRIGTATSRLGDNLYSDRVVALDPDTGKLKWYYQFTPHDEMDYDSTQVPVLADMQWQGKPRAR